MFMHSHNRSLYSTSINWRRKSSIWKTKQNKVDMRRTRSLKRRKPYPLDVGLRHHGAQHCKMFVDLAATVAFDGDVRHPLVLRLLFILAHPGAPSAPLPSWSVTLRRPECGRRGGGTDAKALEGEGRGRRWRGGQGGGVDCVVNKEDGEVGGGIQGRHRHGSGFFFSQLNNFEGEHRTWRRTASYLKLDNF